MTDQCDWSGGRARGCAGSAVQSDEELLDYVRGVLTTFPHAAGKCKSKPAVKVASTDLVNEAKWALSKIPWLLWMRMVKFMESRCPCFPLFHLAIRKPHSASQVAASLQIPLVSLIYLRHALEKGSQRLLGAEIQLQI